MILQEYIKRTYFDLNKYYLDLSWKEFQFRK